jgi:hypothetical protein
LLNNSLKILGYTDQNGNEQLTTRIRNSAIVNINLVYSDLWRIRKAKEPFKPVNSLSDTVDLPNDVLYDVFPYGLCMHIARSENDGDQQQFYAFMYNQKRLSLSRIEIIEDTFIRSGDL